MESPPTYGTTTPASPPRDGRSPHPAARIGEPELALMVAPTPL